MGKIIEMKNEKIGLDWTETDERPQQYNGYIRRMINRLRADEKINNAGYIYRIRRAA